MAASRAISNSSGAVEPGVKRKEELCPSGPLRVCGPHVTLRGSILAARGGQSNLIPEHALAASDPVAHRLREAWVNGEISSPNSVPIVSYGSRLLYTIGAPENRWTLEARD